MADLHDHPQRGFRIATGFPLPALIKPMPGTWWWTEWHMPLGTTEWAWRYDGDVCPRLWDNHIAADGCARGVEIITGLRRFPDFDYGPARRRSATMREANGNVVRLAPKATDLAIPIISGSLPPNPYVLVSPDEFGWTVWLCPRYESGGYVINASHWQRVNYRDRKEDAMTVAQHVAAQLGGLDIVDEPLGGEAV